MNDSGNQGAPARHSRLGWFALLLAAIALTLAAATWASLRKSERQAAVAAREFAQETQRVAQLEARLEKAHAELARIGGVLGADGQPAESVTARLTRVEDSLAQLAGNPAKARLTWLVSQAEYYARAANAQESLAGDPVGALAALQLADDHLRDTGDPRFATVRQRLAGEIASLRAVPRVDREGIALKLNTLSSDLPGLPRKVLAPDHFSGRPSADVTELSGWERLVAALREGLLRVISIRRSDSPLMPLLADEGFAVLVRGLELELQMARLAILRGDATAYQTSVRNVTAGLQKYFDPAAPATAAAMATLAELAATPMPKALPDVSGSLTELRRVRDRELKP
jgi:uroporphyrin-3 C-methyltransferase